MRIMYINYLVYCHFFIIILQAENMIQKNHLHIIQNLHKKNLGLLRKKKLNTNDIA